MIHETTALMRELGFDIDIFQVNMSDMLEPGQPEFLVIGFFYKGIEWFIKFTGKELESRDDKKIAEAVSTQMINLINARVNP